MTAEPRDKVEKTERMNSSWRRILIGASFLATTSVIAVFGYMLAGWNFLDAIYMVVITVFGVGYGETRPVDDPRLKVFTMGVIIAGCSSGIYVVGGFVQMIAEGEINRVLGTRRMSKGIEQLTGHAIICGYGRVGQMLVSDLAIAKHTLVVIDNSEQRITEAQLAGHLTVLGSASDEPILEAAGIARARVLATVLPDDTANVFITLTARDLNPTIEIISRAESPSTEKKLMRSGATRVVMPALIGATKIAHMITRPSAEEMLVSVLGKTQLNEELREVGLELYQIEIEQSSPLAGQTLADAEIGGGFVIVGVKRGKAFQRHPPPEFALQGGDVFVVFGHAGAIPKLGRRAKARAVGTYRGMAS
jgi:voltage-gated potassium channel